MKGLLTTTKSKINFFIQSSFLYKEHNLTVFERKLTHEISVEKVATIVRSVIVNEKQGSRNLYFRNHGFLFKLSSNILVPFYYYMFIKNIKVCDCYYDFCVNKQINE